MRRACNRSRRFARIASSVAIAFGLASAAYAAETYEIDKVHSTVLFKVRHLGVSDAHGRFDDVSGQFVVDEASPSGSRVEVTLKTESINTNAPDRDKHLKSPDFFNAKQFPTITFKSTSVKKTADKEYEVTGDLSLHGVTKPITVTLVNVGTASTKRGYRSGYSGAFTLKRSDYDMKFLLDGVGDEVQVTIAIEGVRK